MNKDEMIRRIRKATPEWNAILGDPQPAEEPFMTEKQFDAIKEGMNYIASKNFENIPHHERTALLVLCQMSAWGLAKNSGDFAKEPLHDETSKPTKAQVTRLYNYITQ